MSLPFPASAPRLAGTRVVLRSPRPDDIDGRQRLGKDPSIMRAFGGSPGFDSPQPMTRAEAEGILGLHRIALQVLATNTRARRCYRRCGFVEEGIEREAALMDGLWHDDVMMAVLAHETRPASPA